MAQAVASSRKGKTPVVFLSKKREFHSMKHLIIFRAKDFMDKLNNE